MFAGRLFHMTGVDCGVRKNVWRTHVVSLGTVSSGTWQNVI